MNRTIRACTAALTTALLFTLSLSAFAQAKVDLQSNTYHKTDAAHPGSTVQIALEIKLQHGFHVQSNIPLDKFTIATVISADTPEGLLLTEVVYPQHIEIVTGGFTTPQAVFEEEFVAGVAITLDPSLAPGAYNFTLKMYYQACDDTVCLQPQTLELSETINIVDASTPLSEQHNDIFAGLNFTGTSTPIETVDPTPTVITSNVEDTDTIMPLLEKFDIAGTSTFLKTPAFLEFIDDSKAGKVSEGWFENKGPIAIVILILIGGVALNMTPCVLPLIPINLAIIGAGAQADSKTRGFTLGLAYGLAMAVVYGGLGLIVILTAGTFGTINASPWFNIGIAILFVVLALAMFDVIQIDFTRFQSKLNLAEKGKKGSITLAFGMGGVSALLAGACVAPIVIQVIVFSSDLYNKGATLALSLPFFLGLGMALPWPLAGAGMSVMPKPGAWMVRVKQAMGVFILVFAAYYGYLAYGIFDSRNVDPEKVEAGVQELLKEGWTPSMTQGLEQALEEDKFVLVDMWATWCKNCAVMNATTLKDPEVKDQLKDFVKIKFQAEDLEASPANEVLNHFEGIGLPTLAILRPKSDEK
jgi:thiol:disulfide interchange protein